MNKVNLLLLRIGNHINSFVPIQEVGPAAGDQSEPLAFGGAQVLGMFKQLIIISTRERNLLYFFHHINMPVPTLGESRDFVPWSHLF